MLPWGGVWEVLTIPVLGVGIFDFFFTLCIIFGLVSLMVGWLFKIVVRS